MVLIGPMDVGCWMLVAGKHIFSPLQMDTWLYEMGRSALNVQSRKEDDVAL